MDVRTGTRPRYVKVFTVACTIVALSPFLAAAVFGWLIGGSLPRLDGDIRLGGLGQTVLVARDALGVPTISGQSRADVAFATGFLHAQDRFFQMDLLRRTAAGELAALLGPKALDRDLENRFHRFRHRASGVLQSLSHAEQDLLQHYADGVNAGLSGLREAPFEYLLLGQEPRPWEPLDSLLVVWSMYLDLQGNLEARELGRGWLRNHATAAQFAYLLPESTAYDTPLDGGEGTLRPAPAPSQGPDWFARGADQEQEPPSAGPLSAVGSNSWALSGWRSLHRGAIVADDMHLDLGLSQIWYRAELRFPDADGQTMTLTGITLPGLPNLVVGSNRKVAWGFTNGYCDNLDLVSLRRDPGDPLRFQTARGWETAEVHREIVQIAGQADRVLEVLETSLGPLRLIGEDAYAVRWIAHEPFAVDLRMIGLETATSVEEALQVAMAAGLPAQNILVADHRGDIGWTIAGPLPDRPATFDTTAPLTLGGEPLWRGRLPVARYPRLLNPPSGQLWSANNRQLQGPLHARLGDGGADLGARARQIRNALRSLPLADEKLLYRIGLDDRALFMATWRVRALDLLSDAKVAGHPQRAEFRRLLRESWSGRASIDSVGYQLTRSFYYHLYLELFGGLDARMAATFPDSDFELVNPRWPAVVEGLLQQRPTGWLPSGTSWDDVQLAAVDAAIAHLTASGRALSDATWGRRNTLQVAHPLADTLPLFRYWLSAPEEQIAGDDHMPRVQGPDFGQSQRMVVSPGHEDEGFFNMPGGQSGHPLSPYFLAGHDEWVKGTPTPFLPGPADHRLRLLPRS